MRLKLQLVDNVRVLEKIQKECLYPDSSTGFFLPPHHPIFCRNASRLLWFSAADPVLTLLHMGREDLLDKALEEFKKNRPLLVDVRIKNFFRYSPRHLEEVDMYLKEEGYALKEIGEISFYRRPKASH
jgi:hypothetical protein